MIDVNTYLAVQQVMRDLTYNARPDAPVRPDRVPAKRRMAIADTTRYSLSLTLRRLADIVWPGGPNATPPLPAARVV